MYDGEKGEELPEITFADELIEYLELDLRPFANVLNRLKAQTKENTSLEKLQSTFDTIGWITGNFNVEKPLYSFLLTTQINCRFFEITHSDQFYVIKDQAVDSLFHTVHAQSMFYAVCDAYCRAEGTHEEKFNKVFTGRGSLFKLQLEQVIAHTEVSTKMFYLNNRSLPYSRGYRFENLPDYMWYIFLSTMEYDIKFSQCDYCGHFFIPKTKKKTLYCDRVRTDDGRTCKQIGPAQIYKMRLKHSELLADYDRAVNRNYRRLERFELKPDDEKHGKDMTFIEYADWLREAQEAKTAFLKGEMSEKQFAEVIHRAD